MWIDIIKNSMVSVIVWSFCLSLWGVRSQSVKPLSNRLIWDGIHSSVLSFTNCGIKNNLILQSITRLVLFSCSSSFFPTFSFGRRVKKKKWRLHFNKIFSSVHEGMYTRIDDPTAEIVSPKYFITSEGNESQDIWGLFHESSSNAAEVPWQTPSGVILSVPFPSFSSLQSSIYHSIIPSSVLSLFCHYLCHAGWLLAIVARHQIGWNACNVSKSVQDGLFGVGGSTLLVTQDKTSHIA